MATYSTRDIKRGLFDNHSAARLRQAAQRVSADMARATQNGPVRDSYLQDQEHLKAWLLREAARRT